MSKILVVGDVHWSKYSSILRTRGKEYSTRLENLIESVNWCEKLAVSKKADMMVYLGDFFDTADLNAEEITALDDVCWNSMNHYFLVGNHEMGTNDLSTSSTEIFWMRPGMFVVNYPFDMHLGDRELVLLPYILDNDKRVMSDYVRSEHKDRVIFSHNDIAGVQMGAFMSKEGFEVSDIEENCALFINGHLHNGTDVTNKIINLGNLTGQNFSEDILTYKHKVMLLDTETLEIEYFENPYSIGFIKFSDLNSFKECRAGLTPELTCVVVRVNEDEIPEAKELLNGFLASRLLVAPVEKKENIEHEEQNLSMNHLERFVDFVKETFEMDSTVEEELEKVVK